MYKDILIDNDAAMNFINPMNEHYKEFYKWLFAEGSLAVCNKLIQQYETSLRNAVTDGTDSNVVVILEKQRRDNRLNKISNDCLKKFIIKKHRLKKLKAKNDLPIFKTVLLSDRKYAITEDKKLMNDINRYPSYKGRKAMAVGCPSKIKYKE